MHVINESMNHKTINQSIKCWDYSPCLQIVFLLHTVEVEYFTYSLNYDAIAGELHRIVSIQTLCVTHDMMNKLVGLFAGLVFNGTSTKTIQFQLHCGDETNEETTMVSWITVANSRHSRRVYYAWNNSYLAYNVVKACSSVNAN